MLKRICLIISFLLLPLALAEGETPNTVLTFVDAVSKELISDVYVKTDLNGETTNYFLEKDENLKLRLDKGDHRLKILINNPQTKGYDYYGDTLLQVENNLIKVIYLYPVGSLSGFVKDKLDTAISEADLKFDCNKAISLDYPRKADKFGSFSLDYVPVGNCKVYGSFKESLGVKEIEIKKGEKNFVDIKLDIVLILPKDKDYSFFGFGIFVIILLIAGVLVYYFRKKTKSLEKKEKKEEKEIKELKEEIKEVKSIEDLGRRGKDLFKTLRDNEKKIIKFLVEQKEPIYFSQIHYKTGLSKGSLFRNLRSLERKNIVKTFREGKVRKVKLSGWFLER